MGKDSRLPHEFDLTDLVTPGRPFDLALTVVQWSDATYLEDQDHWYHAGLHRSVFLRARPAVHIADVDAVADFDPVTGAGHLEARILVDTEGHGPSAWTTTVALADQSVTSEVRFGHASNWAVNSMLFEGRRVRASLTLPDVRPWTAETPVLHDLTVTLHDQSGSTVDRVSVAVGFRRVEVRGHELLVNGRPVLFKGVNRHDHDPVRGKAVTRESIEHDIVLMKRHGLNAVRTSHYPSDEHLYEVCDRLGMYVIDEANIESHAYLRSLSKDPIWAGAILERIMRMAIRDVNHPCVVIWSLGNESGGSPAHQAAAAWLRAWDPSRPVQYEGALGEELISTLLAHPAATMAVPTAESDIVAPMYTAVDELVAWATRSTPTQPLILCEYIHAMGNSCGSLDEYWAAIRTHPGLQGGFAWDWVDQALEQELPDGRRRLAYGGDFGDEPHDGPFCMNGLVSADRTPHPSLVEMAKVVQPVHVHAVDAARGVLEVTNENGFVDLSWLRPTWVVEVDGKEVAAGALEPLAIDAGASALVRVPLPERPRLAPGERAHFTLRFETAADRPWAPAGHVVAWDQFELASAPGPTCAPGPIRARSLDALDPTLALWRAPIDNETFGARHAARWDQLGLRDPSALGIVMTTDVVAADGALGVSHAVEVPATLDDIPRVGVRLDIGAGVDAVEWLGGGPHECYSDRRASACFGRWTTAVDDWPVPYVHPQASGNRVGVRWLRLLGADGTPLLTIDHLDDLQVTVSRWTDAELADAAHLEDLPRRDSCWVWIDAAHRGVGSGACGPDTASAHRVGPGHYRWSYRLR
jgi:beta-galactosidase